MDLLRGRWLVAITVVLFVVYSLSARSDGELDDWIGLGLAVANVAPLLLLGRNPLAVALAFGVTYPLWLDPVGAGVVREGHVLQSLPTLVALYATGAWRRPLWLRAFGLITPAWMIGAAVSGYWATDVDELAFVALVLVIVWCLGVVDAGRRASVNELEVRTRELEAARHALADQAVAEERARIARELHDVVAHAMSVITVQAGVGGHLLGTRPHRAAEALDIIERTGREALAELRRMLVVLRPSALVGLQLPQPGIDDLPQLFANARSSGLRVMMTQHGAVTALSPGLGLTIYRVVQESLTNAAKHAPGTDVDVALTFTPTHVIVAVRDNGPGAPTGVTRGLGLTGMSERVALYDGTLDMGGGSDGFVVTATFPVDGAAEVSW